MLLAVDIGNTNITLGLFQRKRLIRSWRVSSEPRRTVDEHGLLLKRLLGRALPGIKTVAVASVVPALDAVYRECCQTLFRRAPTAIDCTSPLGFRIAYHPPEDVGADRLANVAAAIELVGAPVVIVDFGTAVTLDVLNRRKEYVGGIISPGLELAAESLFRRTAKLPHVALAAPRFTIGRSTLESLQSGLVLGCAAQVDGLLERVFTELGERASVIGTGGAAPVVVPHTRHIRRVEPDLTLDGIRIVADRIRSVSTRSTRRSRGRARR